MLFKRRKKSGVPPRGDGETSSSGSPLGYFIEFETMLKGRAFRRGSENVRQFGVTVNGSTKLVTSGDWVDRETYIALIDAGAIPPDPAVESTRAARKRQILADPTDGTGTNG
jgi:hypothetical protein